ncbi:MAG: hypothetical protein U1G07_04175 [Verrucomicrobiota bacterium]
MQHPLAPLGSEQPVPTGLDYDLWCGPAAKLPYVSNRAWLNFAEYSCGPIPGDLVHQIDLARYLMGDPPPPKTVSHSGGILALKDGRDLPDTQLATYEFERFTLLAAEFPLDSYLKKIPNKSGITTSFPTPAIHRHQSRGARHEAIHVFRTPRRWLAGARTPTTRWWRSAWPASGQSPY